MVAEQFKHKACGRHLFLFRWQQRAKKMQPSMEIPLKAHQMYDSAYPVWRSGKRCQLYMTKLPPPGEFEGTRIDSRPYQPFSEKSFRKRFGSPPNLQMIQTTQHHGGRKSRSNTSLLAHTISDCCFTDRIKLFQCQTENDNHFVFGKCWLFWHLCPF